MRQSRAQRRKLLINLVKLLARYYLYGQTAAKRSPLSQKGCQSLIKTIQGLSEGKWKDLVLVRQTIRSGRTDITEWTYPDRIPGVNLKKSWLLWFIPLLIEKCSSTNSCYNSIPSILYTDVIYTLVVSLRSPRVSLSLLGLSTREKKTHIYAKIVNNVKCFMNCMRFWLFCYTLVYRLETFTCIFLVLYFVMSPRRSLYIFIFIF